MDVILAIDGGGSRTRCQVIDRSGRRLCSAESGASNHLLVAMEVVRHSLSEAIRKTLTQAPLDRSEVVCVSAGLAGVDYDGSGVSDIEPVLREIGFSRLAIYGDMMIAHSGALAGRPGILALAGTGSSILGIGTEGERVKIGGWGPVYGDEGSAYWIAQQSLVMAARAYDGRGLKTALVGAILEALGLKDFKETVSRIYVAGMETREIAALSRVAHEVAMAGDTVARNIFVHAGKDIAEGVAAAIRRLGIENHAPLVSYQGSVLESCALVRDAFITSLQQRIPQASVFPPRFEPVIGAFLLGCKVLGWPIDSCLLQILEEQSATRMKKAEAIE